MEKTRVTWTIEEKEYLKEIVPGKHYKEILDLMNKRFSDRNFTQSQLKGAINRYKLNTGFTGRFAEGSTPPNKGTKGICKSNKTSFKKGQKAINHRKVGSERVNVYGYTEVKVAEPSKWVLKHKLVWEENNGPIEEGNVVIFGDGDRSNLDIKNLILITNKQLLMLNRKKLIQNDADLTRTGVIIADIYQKIADKKSDLLKEVD